MIWSVLTGSPFLPSVVVDDLDILRSGGRPSEADAPLPVDADAVGAGSLALELLQPIARRNSEVVEGLSGVQDQQLSQRHALRALVELTYRPSLPDSLGLLIRERTQHLAVW